MVGFFDKLRQRMRPNAAQHFTKPPEIDECELLVAILESCPERSRFTFDGYEDESLAALLTPSDGDGGYVVSALRLSRLRAGLTPAQLRSCPHLSVYGLDGAPLFTSHDHFDPIMFVDPSIAERLRERFSSLRGESDGSTLIQIDGQSFDSRIAYFQFEGFHEVADSSELNKLRLFPRLEGASFSGSKLDDVGLAHVCAVPTIENLDLQETDISDEGLAHLAALPSLKHLRLKENERLTNACIPASPPAHHSQPSIARAARRATRPRLRLRSRPSLRLFGPIIVPRPARQHRPVLSTHRASPPADNRRRHPSA